MAFGVNHRPSKKLLTAKVAKSFANVAKKSRTLNPHADGKG